MNKKGLLLGILFLILILPVQGAVLCSYPGPYSYPPHLELSDYQVEVPSDLKLGDQITVKFDLKNWGKEPINFTSKGIFAAARDKDNQNKDFGHSLRNKYLDVDGVFPFKESLIIDKRGVWKIWPSYEYWKNPEVSAQGAEQYVCFVAVCPNYCQNNIRYYDAYYTAEGECVYAQEECEYGCDKERMGCQEIRDSDEDGITDEEDNCPTISNPDQVDTDNDGTGNTCDNCPETYNPEQVDTDDNGIGDACEDTIPPIASIKKEPRDLKPGDRVKILVEAEDSSGIGLIEIWINNQKRKQCYHKACSYLTPPITKDPLIGVKVLDKIGNILIEGPVPEVEISFNDTDEDNITDTLDNCPQVSNPNQRDNDKDGIGDACDQCEVKKACLTPSPAHFIDCQENELRFLENNLYYYDTAYDLVSQTGCGCQDTDQISYFEKGQIFTEHISRDIFRVARREECVPWSKCRVAREDTCLNSSHLTEFICTVKGIENLTIECEYGCSGGKCNCPDSDGGINYYERGFLAGRADYCEDEETLNEYFCDLEGIESEEVSCPYGCENGACLCTDSDQGINYSLKGQIASSEDYCVDSRKLVEFYTIAKEKTCDVYSQEYTCPGLCQEGECLPPSCADGIRNRDEEEVDCGGNYCPFCSQCETEAKWSPHDTPCKHHWPTEEGAKIEMNTKDDSCALIEVCHPELDYIVKDALVCCEYPNYAVRFNGHREIEKETACSYARNNSGINLNYNPLIFKKCLGLYAIKGLESSAVYMQGYFKGEWCCYGDANVCPANCSKYKVEPAVWEMGTALSCLGVRGARPDFTMGGHNCEYNSASVPHPVMPWKKHSIRKWGKAGYWRSDTDYRENSDSLVDLPAHASINKLSTGTCVDYSFALTTILRKLGYSKDDVFSVNGEEHAYNLVRFLGEIKWHYVDTVGNHGGGVYGGTGFSPIYWFDRLVAWYDYCKKLDAGCSNDFYSQSREHCPSNNQIYSCEGISR